MCLYVPKLGPRLCDAPDSTLTIRRVQPGTTYTRDAVLLDAAEIIARDGAAVAAVLRESRLETWQETDPHDEQWCALLFDQTLASGFARVRCCGRLVIPAEPGAWEIINEDQGLTWDVLHQLLPELETLDVVEADVGELAAQRPDSPVRACGWRDLWFRSKAEVRIAEALDRANVVFAPNASVRRGVTQDHRETVEPDFLVVSAGKVG